MSRFMQREVLFAPENEEGAEPEEGDEPAEGEELEEGDEPAEGEELEEGDEPAEGDEPKPTRGETRVQKAVNETRVEREKRIALEAEVRTLRERPAARADDGEAAKVRAEKLILMEPAERAAFLATEKADSLGQMVQMQNTAIADMRDEQRYDALAARNTAEGKVAAKHKDWIENALREARAKGNNPTREALLNWKIGADAREALKNPKVAKKLKDAKEAAGKRVATSQGQSTSGKGDVGRGKSDGESIDDIKARIEAEERRRGVRS